MHIHHMKLLFVILKNHFTNFLLNFLKKWKNFYCKFYYKNWQSFPQFRVMIYNFFGIWRSILFINFNFLDFQISSILFIILENLTKKSQKSISKKYENNFEKSQIFCHTFLKKIIMHLVLRKFRIGYTF